MKLSHTKLIVISGMIWFAIGIYLLQLGLNLILTDLQSGIKGGSENYPLLTALKPYLGSMQTSALITIVAALFLGYLKGRYVLGKSANRGTARILSFPSPVSITRIYNRQYYLLIGAMVGLGISIKYLGLSNDVRGLIDTTIGAALINGAMVYFKLAQGVKARS